MGYSLLGANVGGLIEFHYGHPALGPVYPIRLAVALFDPTPSGADGDYLYTGAGGYTPSETGLIATFRAIAALWAPYYDSAWSCALAAVYGNDGGVPQPALALPSAAPLAGSSSTPVPGSGSAAKRSISIYSLYNARWRIWLRQQPVIGVGQTETCTVASGGFDTRDQAWYAYFASRNSGVVGRDGVQISQTGEVRGWWDTPPSPYLVSG